MFRFDVFILLSSFFVLSITADTGPTTTVSPVVGNSTGNVTEPKEKPPIDIHKIGYFNLTDFINEYPNETEDHKQWSLHLIEEAGKLLDQITMNRMVRDTMTVGNYEKMEDTPIQIEKMEKVEVKDADIIYHKGNIRRDIFKHYKDKNLYYSFEIFYEDMPSAEIFIQAENGNGEFYDWGTVYNQSINGTQQVLQKYQIYLRKWMSAEEAYNTPNSVFIKEYTYKVNLTETCETLGYYYTYRYCISHVTQIEDAQVIYFINTGRVRKCSCNCGYTDVVVAPDFVPSVRKPTYTTTTTQKPITAAVSTMASTTVASSVTVSTTQAPATQTQTKKSSSGITTPSSPVTTIPGSTETKITTTLAPTTTTTNATAVDIFTGKHFTAEIHSIYVFKNNGKFDNYGESYHMTITVNDSESTDVKKHSSIDLETLILEPANLRQLKFNPKVVINQESVNELHGNAHTAIGFSKTEEPMFMVDFEDGNSTINYHAVELYVNMTEASNGNLYQNKYKYHVEMYKVTIMDHVAPSTTKNQRRAILIAKFSFYSNCEDNQCQSVDTTTEFFTNVGVSPAIDTGLTLENILIIVSLSLVAVVAVIGFVYFCCAKKSQKGTERPPSVQFNGEDVHLVNPNYEEVNPAHGVENPVHLIEHPDIVIENVNLNVLENQENEVDEEAPIYGLLNPVYGDQSQV